MSAAALTVLLASVALANEHQHLVLAPGAALPPLVARIEGIESAWNGEALTPLRLPLQAPVAEGTHWLALVRRSPGRLLSAPSWRRVVVDGTSPALEVELPEPAVRDGERTWLAPDARLRVQATDSSSVTLLRAAAGSSVELAADGQRELLLPVRPASGAGGHTSGPLALVVEAVDEAGNQARIERSDLAVDATAPSVRIQRAGPWVEVDGTLVAGPQTRLNAPVDDAESGVAAVSLARADVAVEAPQWCCAEAPEGRLQLQVVATDRVGNAATLEQTVIVDRTGPLLEVAVDAARHVEIDGTTVYSSPALVSLFASDAVAGVASLQWSAGASGPRAWRGEPFSLSSSSELLVEALDAVENGTRETVRIAVDAEPPTLALQAAGGVAQPPQTRLVTFAGTELEVIAADGLSGVEVVETGWRYRGASQPSAVFGTPRTLRFDTWGEYLVQARARDGVGLETVGEWRVTVRRRQRP